MVLEHLVARLLECIPKLDDRRGMIRLSPRILVARRRSDQGTTTGTVVATEYPYQYTKRRVSNLEHPPLFHLEVVGHEG